MKNLLRTSKILIALLVSFTLCAGMLCFAMQGTPKTAFASAPDADPTHWSYATNDDGAGTITLTEYKESSTICVVPATLTDNGITYTVTRVGGRDWIILDEGVKTLDTSACGANLIYLNCQVESLTGLNLHGNTGLLQLDCSGSGITSLDLSSSPGLRTLSCDSSDLTSLDVSHNPALTDLSCGWIGLTSLDVSHNPNLELLYCDGNKLTGLDVDHNPKLRDLACAENNLTDLDVSHNPDLTELSCNVNELSTLDITHNPQLGDLDCSRNHISDLAFLNDMTKKFGSSYVLPQRLKAAFFSWTTANAFNGSPAPAQIRAKVQGVGTITPCYKQTGSAAELTTVPPTARGSYDLYAAATAGTIFDETGEDLEGALYLGVYQITGPVTVPGKALFRYTDTKVYNKNKQSAGVSAKVAGIGSITTYYARKGSKVYTTEAPAKVGRYDIAVTTKAGSRYAARTTRLYLGSYTIVPHQGAAPKLKARNNKLKVSWKNYSASKDNQSFVQIGYKVGKKWTYAKVSGKATSYTLKLKDKKRYTVKIRVGCTVQGTDLYSSFTTSKSAKTK